MQRQPTSMFLMAETYRQELLADAARVRPHTAPGAGGPTALPRLARCSQVIGAALIRAGQRLQGPTRTSPADSALAPPNGLGPAR
jgi:hypothetical protein